MHPCFKKLTNKKPVITILHEFHKPPWGGGNQFLLALKARFEKKGYQVTPKVNSQARICIINSFNFNPADLQELKDTKACIIHRVDGPVQLVRGKDEHLDNYIFKVNKIAQVTVFQSKWSHRQTLRLGFNPINPVIIYNSVNPEIFSQKERLPFSLNRKIRLVSTSWSDNWLKGFRYYQKIDKQLDFNSYEYTYVGRSPIKLKHIKMIGPQNSKQLANILKNHDIYITASQNEPCSNALLEALACGLPVLYLKGSSHKELVKKAGLGFDLKSSLNHLLKKLIRDYNSYQNQIDIPDIDTIADSYLELAKK